MKWKGSYGSAMFLSCLYDYCFPPVNSNIKRYPFESQTQRQEDNIYRM
jgi:hypothetical protein